MDDGVRDGIISQPLNCRFRPEELACKKGSAAGCLNPMQVAAAQKIYSGPVDSAGQPMFGGGALPGSESGWSKYYLDDRQGQRAYMFPLTNNGMRYLFSSPELDADWSIEKFQFDSDYKRMDVMQALYDSSNPDLTRFRATGAKLIIYMGMNDISIPRSVINYYLKVERVMGGQEETRSFARLYLLPGVDHCGGGPGADTVDYLGYLEDWVERGTAPDRLVAYHLKGSNGATALESYPPSPQVVEFSRPVYPYPAFAKYSGHGDPKDANSFGPSEP
jgi:feruloyl esterase